MISIGQIVDVIEDSADRYQKSRSEQNKSFNIQSALKSNDKQQDIIYKYKIRIPFLHGAAGESSSTPTSQLPIATFCPIPGAEHTRLSIGDLVYVSTVDFDFSKIVVLGLVSPDQAIYNRGGASLTRVQKLEIDENGTSRLNENTTITDGETEVNWDNIKSLEGFEHRLYDYVWPLECGGTGKRISDDLGDGLAAAQKEVRDNFGIFSTKIVSSSEFEKIRAKSLYEKNTIYYIWDDRLTPESSVQTGTTQNMGTGTDQYGQYALDFLWRIVPNYTARINNPTYTGYDGYGPANRTDLWQSKVDFGKKIKQTLQSMKYEVRELSGNRPQQDPQHVINNNIKSYICTAKGKDSTKKIVIGAHYDSVYTDGIEDNGTGVSVLLELAQRFKTFTPNFDVDFCFWDGEEFLSFAGSYSYVSQLSDGEKAKILLYINLDSVGAGDKLFVYGGKYAGNGNLALAWGYKFAKQIANENGIELNEIPLIHTTNPNYTDQQFKPPTRLVASDQYFFQDVVIPYVYFEANAWVEKDGKTTGNPYKPYMYNTINPSIVATSYLVPDKNGNMSGTKYETENGQLIHAQDYDSYNFLYNTKEFKDKIQTHVPQVSKIVSNMLTKITLSTPNQYK